MLTESMRRAAASLSANFQWQPEAPWPFLPSASYPWSRRQRFGSKLLSPIAWAEHTSPTPPSAIVGPPKDCLRILRFRRSEEHTSELQSRLHLVCRLLLANKNNMLTSF